MRKVIGTLAAIALLALVPGAIAQTGSNILVGTQWQLVSYGAPGAETPVLAGSSPTLMFESENQLTGHGGCNGFGGGYAVQGDTLTVQDVVSTLMACADQEVTRQEQAYLEGLRFAQRYELAGDRLVISYLGGQLTFQRMGGTVPPQQPAPPAQGEAFEDLTNPVALLASYYNAITLQDYQRAYNYWETPREPFEEFVSGFADTASVQVIVEPPTRYSGAAGSLYVDIPTVLIAQHHDGGQVTFAGCFIARKSNLQPPDIPEPDVWHLYNANLTEVTGQANIPALLAEACPIQ